MDLARLRERFEFVCRFCLTEEDCIAIFTGGEDYQFNDRLAKVVDILLAKVDESDGLPNNVCTRCVHCIEQFVEFEASCVKSYEILEEVARMGGEEHEDEADVKPIKVELHTALKTDETAEEYLTDQSNDEHGLQSDTFPEEEEANIERLEDDEQISILDEQMVQQGDELMEDVAEEDDEIEEPPESTSYNLSTEQQQMINAAMETAPSGFIERGSRQIPLVECIYCKNVYRGRNTLKKHLKIHLNIKDYQCAHCSRTFTDRSSLRIHEGRHSGKSYQCTQCDKTYFSQNELRQHLTMQHLERKYSCDTCQRKFPSKSILNDHYRVHLPDRPFECKVCGAGFKRNRNLIRHQQLHQQKFDAKLMMLSCPVCPTSMDRPAALVTHLEQDHSDVLDSVRSGFHECPQCDGGKFNDLLECLQHQQQKHYAPSKEKQEQEPHTCGECGKKFKLRKSALKHVLIHGAGGPFECEEKNCKYVFPNENSLESHRTEAHESDDR